MSSSGTVIEGSYDYGVVVLSAIIAVLSSLAALEFADRFAISPQRPRRFWLLGWALSQGGGIWAMHYTGMLAFRLPLPTSAVGQSPVVCDRDGGSRRHDSRGAA